MSGRLDGKVAVVTGGSSGIGAATVASFVAEGARVVVADLHEPEPDLWPDGTWLFARTDVSREEDVAAAVDVAVAELGGLDVMVNNAGILGAVGPIAEQDAGDWRRTVDVLVNGAFHGIKHAARVMVPQRSGTIVSVASIAGLQGGIGPHAYTTAKHAVIGLTRSAASELGPHGIRVNAVAPGVMATPLSAYAIAGDRSAMERAEEQIASESLLGTAGTAQDIADAVLYLSGPESRYVTGHCLVVDAGATATTGSARVHHLRPALITEEGRVRSFTERNRFQ
ncbi:MAG: glucose 1-dehydrogenase [Acidimicrobiales bacterium]|nr:glucose 1-dehydrogenase [Acidimicrobiales bacterium]